MVSLRALHICAACAVLLTAAPAHAQGFFDSLFGRGQRNDSWFGSRPQQPIPPQGNGYSDPSNPSDRPVSGDGPGPSGGSGRVMAYCVRTCDGRYFPMQRQVNANPVQLCSAFCPAAKTMVFNGSQIDYAVAANGARYGDLDNAFVYRKRIVEGCTCNGKDAFGLARIDVANDPTLRQGDIVASGDNVKAALIAMAAAKERQLVAREAANERTVRPGTLRRVAGPPAAAPAEAEIAPGDEAEPRPED